jgi:hypothetical protein
MILDKKSILAWKELHEEKVDPKDHLKSVQIHT